MSWKTAGYVWLWYAALALAFGQMTTAGFFAWCGIVFIVLGSRSTSKNDQP